MIDPRFASLLLLTALVGSGCASAPSAEADEVFRRGLEQAENGDVDAAMKTLGGGVAAHPSHTRMRFELARLQYESGEVHHRRERRAFRDAAVYSEAGKRSEADTQRREGAKHRAKATPYYERARDNLEVVIDDEDDEPRLGWAYYLMTRVAIFFQDWSLAYESLDKAIEYGHPSGARLAEWREFQSGLRDKVRADLDY